MFIKEIKRLNIYLWIIAAIIIQNLHAQYKNIQIDYFGQDPPGKKAEIFSPDFICTPNAFIQNCCFSADGKEFVYVVTNKDWSASTIMYTKYENEQWSSPVPLPCSGNIGSVPYFSYDGNDIYYVLYKYNNTASADIYVSHRTPAGWSEPERLEVPINSDQDEWEVCISENDVLYFSSDRPKGFGKMDIYTSQKTGEKFSNLRNIGAPINTGSLDECPYIAPDESFMVFNDWKPNPKFQGNNLYITYKKEDGSWTNPKDLGNNINSDLLDIYPYITPDGKYLIFTRRDGAFSAASSKLYWTSTEFIDSLRNTNSEPYWKYNIPNFYDYINRLRVEESKKMLADSSEKKQFWKFITVQFLTANRLLIMHLKNIQGALQLNFEKRRFKRLLQPAEISFIRKIHLEIFNIFTS